MSVLRLQFREVTPDIMSRMQDNLSAGIDAVTTPIVSGVLVQSVPLSATQTLVSHGLGRMPLSFAVLAPNASATVWESGTRTATQLALTASGTVTVDLWVF